MPIRHLRDEIGHNLRFMTVNGKDPLPMEKGCYSVASPKSLEKPYYYLISLNNDT